MQEQYRLKHVLLAAAGKFAKERSIQLQQFLLPEVFRKASVALMRVPLQEYYLPDQYRCHEPRTVPPILNALRAWLQSKECAALVSTVVQKNVRLKDLCVCIYAHGDYTVLHDKNKELPGYDIILDLTPRWDARACGHHSYVKNSNELVRLSPAANTLAIVHRPASVRKFIKYVNHLAGKDRRIVIEARFA